MSQADILRSRRQIADIEAQITTRHNKFFQDAQAEMTKAQEDLNAQSEALNDRTQLLEQTDMTAPSRGLVKSIRVTTLGGVVRAGDIVMELLPTQSGLILEAKVYPADIAFVTVGQTANVKLDAFDSTVYGGFRGEVIYVSPDTLNEETQRGPQPYYRVHVKIDLRHVVTAQLHLGQNIGASRQHIKVVHARHRLARVFGGQPDELLHLCVELGGSLRQLGQATVGGQRLGTCMAQDVSHLVCLEHEVDRSPSTSSVCSPQPGAGATTLEGVRLSTTGWVMKCMSLPNCVGSVVVTFRCLTCSSSNTCGTV